MSYIESNVADARIQNDIQHFSMLLGEMKQNLENYKRASDSIIMTANTNGLGNLKAVEQSDPSTDTEYDIRFREQQQQYQQKMSEVNSLLDTLASDSQSIKQLVSQNLNSIPEMPVLNPIDEEASSERRERDLRETIADAYWNIGGATILMGLVGAIYYMRYRR